jgi:ABC-2 type transport system permease protein
VIEEVAMQKILLIGWKDLKLAFRDRTALLLTLAAPFLLTLGLGFVTGHFAGNAGGIEGIPVVLVNQDGGQLGDALVAVFQSADLAQLVTPAVLADAAAARQQVDADKAAAAVIIPAGFTDSIIPPVGADASRSGPTVAVELYANPTSPTSASVIQTIVERFLGQVEVGRISGQVAVTQLLQAGLIQPQDAAGVGAQIGAGQGTTGGNATPISVKTTANRGEGIRFDPLAYMAPGMALMFLMFATALGGRSFLLERSQGTLPRLLVSPITAGQVLAGKTIGTYLTGVVQMLILIGASALLFSLRWGDWLGVLALVLTAVVAATGWGMVITALAQTPGQVMSIGSAITLLFGILGGTFINMDAMPAWFRLVARITPNAWGLDGFTTLALGGRLGDVLPIAAGLLVMGLALYAAALVVLGRKGIMQP